jgi:hypothetical protein
MLHHGGDNDEKLAGGVETGWWKIDLHGTL